MENNNEINFKELQGKMLNISALVYTAFSHFFLLEINEAKKHVENVKASFDEIHGILQRMTDKQQMKKENEQKVADVNELLNGESEYWPKAMKFSESLVVDDIENKFANYCKEQNFNHNERILFRKFLADAIEFKFTIATLKHLI